MCKTFCLIPPASQQDPPRLSCHRRICPQGVGNILSVELMCKPFRLVSSTLPQQATPGCLPSVT
eukprot:26719_5